MIRKVFLLMIAAMALPAFVAAETWSNVSLIDSQCSTKAHANPDAHTRDCALTCAKSGFGILDKNGHFLKFDATGNTEAIKLLRSTSKKDHLRVDVTGEIEGETIHVKALKM